MKYKKVVDLIDLIEEALDPVILDGFYFEKEGKAAEEARERIKDIYNIQDKEKQKKEWSNLEAELYVRFTKEYLKQIKKINIEWSEDIGIKIKKELLKLEKIELNKIMLITEKITNDFLRYFKKDYLEKNN